MKVCPECFSDSIERTSSVGLRVVMCIILLFIPFGLFICWIPFVFPHTYRCNICGKEGKEEELIGMDWREKEILLEKQKAMEKNLEPTMGKWLKAEENLYKVTKGKGHLLLLQATEEKFKLLRIDDYLPETNTIKVKGEFTKGFEVLTPKSAEPEANSTVDKYEPIAGINVTPKLTEATLTAFGQQLITEEEFSALKDGMGKLQQLLEENKLLDDSLKVLLCAR